MQVKSLMAFVFLLVGIIIPASVSAQSTSFSYQGVFNQNGTPANGSFQMSFSLWTAQSPGGTQVSSTIGPMAVTVTNGSFTVTLDFGSAGFPGADRFLEIAVRDPAAPPPPPPLIILSPRTPLYPGPYAIRSRSAALADTSLTVVGPVTGTAAGATLTVNNAQPGILNPTPVNLPPAALKGEATSTTESNIGVLGIGDGSKGIGVAGITNGNGAGTGQGNAIGVLALATSTNGTTTGLSAQIASPNGTAIEAQTSATGNIFEGDSLDNSSGHPKFLVSALGQVVANGGMFARSFHLNSTNMDILESGAVITNSSVSALSVDTTGNVTVGGTLQAAQANVAGALSVGTSITSSGNANINGSVTAGGFFTSGNSSVGGNLQVSSITAPGGILGLGSTHIITTGDGGFGFVKTGLLSGGNTNVCFDSAGLNYLRTCSSSLRYKNDIHSFTGGLDIVMRLRPISFKWKESGKNDLGLGAEDVAQVEPRLTFKNANGEIEGVQYSQLNVVLINAIKQQQEEINSLKKLVCGHHRKATACR